MKYCDEYRDPETVQRYLACIREIAIEPTTIMEICGGQTHNIIRFGINQALPEQVELIHGPGCPVCVTPAEKIDNAIALAARRDTLLCTFGDMLRVPGSTQSLQSARASGANVQTVYSPTDALKIAKAKPELEVVFFAVGFETTAPANAMPIYLAEREGVENFSMIVSHVLVAPAMRAVLSHPDCRIQGFLAAGHVCTITGYQEYLPIAREFDIPIVVTGFEPVDLLEGISRCIKMIHSRQYSVSNQYARSVTWVGNIPAQEMVRRVFEVTDMNWRGIGTIPRSGLRLRESYARFDAELRFRYDVALPTATSDSGRCHAGQILQGLIKPPACPHFAKTCRPENPIGAPMVSSEGACAAYYHFGSLTEVSR